MDEQENYRQDDGFRDSISTVDEQGKRSWVFPKKPSGTFYRYRKYASYFLLVILFSFPFIKVDGNQFMLFNVLERRFNVFGFAFWPQDFYIFVLFIIVGVIFITLFTVSFGRVFCGWICPQTIFMEMVFRRIEYWIEGDWGKQKRLAKQPWNAEKIRKKGFKGVIFFAISFLISNVFLAYVIGSDKLLAYITESPSEHFGTLITLLIFSILFYFVFAWFREQVCVIACPYGRLQSVLLDNKSIVVAYDYKRGERTKGRKKFHKAENRSTLGYGDCIDCHQCVQVCPTGIDIRNGTQLECVNCTACIDECDHIMDKVGYPKGLIRYASIDNIETKKSFGLSARQKAYSVVLILLMGVLSSMLFLRSDIQATVLRIPGQLYQEKNGIISNVYTYRLINKTIHPMKGLTIKMLSPLEIGKLETVGNKHIFEIPKRGFTEGTFFVKIEGKLMNQEELPVKFGVYKGEELLSTATANFMGQRTFR